MRCEQSQTDMGRTSKRSTCEGNLSDKPLQQQKNRCLTGHMPCHNFIPATGVPVKRMRQSAFSRRTALPKRVEIVRMTWASSQITFDPATQNSTQKDRQWLVPTEFDSPCDPQPTPPPLCAGKQGPTALSRPLRPFRGLVSLQSRAGSTG